MLPLLHQQQYEELQQRLAQADSCIDDSTALKAAIAQVQHWFQQQILTLNLDELPDTEAQRVRSIQVEINKQLRLVSVDVLFLQTSKQPATAKQRQQQVHDRLTMLMRYCEAILQKDA